MFAFSRTITTSALGKYTHGGGALSEEERRFYEVNGYIIRKNNVSDALLDEIGKRFVDICNGKVDVGVEIRLVKDASLKEKGVKGVNSVHKVQDCLHDDVFFKYVSDPAVTDVVTSIIGPNITAIHCMLLNKPLDANPNSSMHPLHQDFHGFPFRPPERIVASRQWRSLYGTGNIGFGTATT
ncbi:hypothetical protein Zmor_020777 [Zophobas morio]|uniref:phytanoyl-CoA dioxygenase n=1 Tax=Zophobas morio TaxID=2755281 RepID=A0AA38I448_9CUCU|nr:hypothetical protein Zmor_020765 [Zophobas morio]KAJ3649015.1 hypothetical protein Zmor_020777 [Zophobas morio]